MNAAHPIRSVFQAVITLACWAAIAMTLWPDMCLAKGESGQQLTLGIHTMTWHEHGRDVQGRTYESTTPGLYVKTTSGLTAGVLNNSIGTTSAYAGFTWTTPQTPHGLSAAITAGAITGYRINPTVLVPLVTASVALSPSPRTAVRLIALPKGHPKGAAAVNLAYEVRF